MQGVEQMLLQFNPFGPDLVEALAMAAVVAVVFEGVLQILAGVCLAIMG